MWFNRILQRVPAKHKTQEKITAWIANTSWIEDWVKEMVKKDKYFFYKRRLITEEGISFADPINYTIELVREIVKNLGLPSKNIVVAFSGVSSAGKIEHRTGEPYFVEIANKWKDNRIAIAAIIAHEMAHAWMDEQGFCETDTQMNEKLTDLSAILLGLGVLLMNGLGVEKIIPLKTTYDLSGTQTEHKRQLRIQNYINKIEMGYAMSIFAAHKGIHDDELQKKMNSEAALAFASGNIKFISRQDEIRNNKQVESWIVLCSGCFQKLRIPNHTKDIEVSCPLCLRKTKYSSGRLIATAEFSR